MTTKPSPISNVGEIEPGAIVVIPFPYADRFEEKRRPALVVTHRVLAKAGFVWVVMITTARRGVQKHDVKVDDHTAAGLSVPCVVRPTKIACIEPSRILRRAGRLEEDAAQKVFASVRSFIGSGATGKEGIGENG
jgi:mRNA interferase MazF